MASNCIVLNLAMTGLRWDGDERGFGISDAAALVPDVERLVDAMHEPDWVAEDPDAHLLPHLQRACRAPGSPFTLLGAGYDGDVYVVGLQWAGARTEPHAMRRDVWTLLARIAEPSSHVREHTVDGVVRFDVTTGVLDGDSPFRAHGHMLSLRIEPV